jgi:hypothetical protein
MIRNHCSSLNSFMGARFGFVYLYGVHSYTIDHSNYRDSYPCHSRQEIIC